MDYYATDEDNIELLHWLFEENELQVFESYSEYDQTLRRFSSAQETIAGLRLGQPGRRRGHALLSLWAPATNGELHIRRIDLKLPGHTFREQVQGWGLLSLQLGGLTPDGLQPSHVAVNSEKRALKWESTYPELGPVEQWDWRAVTKVSRRITGWIRRQAVEKEGPRPILLGAQAARQAGVRLEPV